MNLEKPPVNTNTSNESQMSVEGIDEEGTPIYSEMKEVLPESYPQVPEEVLKMISDDFKSLEEDNTPLKYGPGTILSLSINSDKRVRYEIANAEKGHYLIAKIHDGQLQENLKGTLMLSNYPREGEENPDLIVCSEAELEDWLS